MLGRNVKHIEEAVSTITSTLLQRARGSDQASWRLLVELHSPLVYQWCRHRRLGPEEARDVSQEVFAAVVGHLNDFQRDEERASFRGWLRRITENKIRDHWRKLQRGTAVQFASDDLADNWPAERPHEDSPESENAAIMNKILEYARDRISPEHWTVFWKLIVDDRSPAEVSKETGFDRAHVYVIKSRVLRQLRDLWAVPPKDRRS